MTQDSSYASASSSSSADELRQAFDPFSQFLFFVSNLLFCSSFLSSFIIHSLSMFFLRLLVSVCPSVRLSVFSPFRLFSDSSSVFS